MGSLEGPYVLSWHASAKKNAGNLAAETERCRACPTPEHESGITHLGERARNIQQYARMKNMGAIILKGVFKVVTASVRELILFCRSRRNASICSTT